MKTSHRLLTASLMLTLLIFPAGCSQQAAAEAPAVKEKLVQLQEIKEETLPVRIKYTGMTSAGEVKKYSFKVPGQLNDVKVEKGSQVYSGQKLASVSTTELELAVQASQLTVQKAERAYQEAKDTYSRLESLFQAGALAENDLKLAKLDLDVKEASYNQAKIDLQAQEIMVNNAVIYADMDGYVVDVLNKAGENIAAGYPVVVVRTGEQRVAVGLAQDDVKRVQVGTQAYVTVGGVEALGKIVKIEAIPDAETRTYNTEILLTQPLNSEQFYLGATAQVELEAGEAKGIWVPIASVLNDGEDYIFVVEDNRAVKKNIKLLDVQGFNVRVEGINPGEQLVVTGMKALKEGTQVRLQSEDETK